MTELKSLIALSGCCIYTNRFDDAKDLLDTFAKIEITQLDPSLLLYVNVLYEYYDFSKDITFIKDSLETAQGIVDRFISELEHTELFEEKLILTEHESEAIEINAFWYSALQVMSFFIRLLKLPTESEVIYSTLAAEVKESFLSKYEDLSEQLWVISVPFTILSTKQQILVLDQIFEGLMIWGFPLGAYYLSYLKAHGNTSQAVADVKKQLSDVGATMREGCNGQIMEIFDEEQQDSLHTNFAQKWSIRKMLKVFRQIDYLNKAIDMKVEEVFEKHIATIQEELKQARVDAISINDSIVEGIHYARNIQENVLPREKDFIESFSDHSIMWKPKDVVGGDIYWLRKFDTGSLLCICDCTGHGTSGALLTMFVVSTLEAIVRADNCQDTAGIIWELEEKLVKVFKLRDEDARVQTNKIREGCDIAVMFIDKEGTITLSSANIHVFLCDGENVKQIKGQRIYIGEGRLKGKEEIETKVIPKCKDHVLYIASDGLFGQVGGPSSEPYGYKEFTDIILCNHGNKQAFISDQIWEAFERYRGTEIRVDDIELVSFRPLKLM